ncbi:MAG: helix-turn-helix transcriptional regulator [Bacteroidaceae bacterium]|nr:helix-turn-helix transcriptional regulator [Bacteroidaceae bacterium]
MNEKERVEYIMRSYNLTPSQFADRAGIQRASVSHILSGRNKASLEVLLKIYDSFPGLDMAWLMTGKGAAPVINEQQPAVVEDALPLSMPELFPLPQTDAPSVKPMEQEPQKAPKPVAARPMAAERAPRRPSRAAVQPDAHNQPRKIKEIRIFYTDGTYETMVPER